MSSSPARYTEAQRVRMRALYAKHRNVRRAAEEFGCAPDVLRRAVDPATAERRRISHRNAYLKSYIPTIGRHRVHRRPQETSDPAFDPRRDGYPEYTSPYAEFLGDPPVGRRQMLAEHAPLEAYNVGDDEDDNTDVGC
jgi:hypothetical protein